MRDLPETIDAVPVDLARARVYEHGWQSWSPTTTYGLTERPHRPATERNRTLAYRPGVAVATAGFQGEGLLAIDPGDGGGVRVYAATDGRVAVPSVRAAVVDERTVVVTADGPVDAVTVATDDVQVALAGWADGYVGRLGVPTPRPAPTIWCSWYHYFTGVAEADVDENVAAMDRLGLGVDVVQIDDGYERQIGDWLLPSGRFASLPDLVSRITQDAGRRAGIWVAPFLVAAGSRLAAEHPDWLVRARNGDGLADAGWNWDQQQFALDVTHPDAAAHLTEVLRTFRGWGIDFFKVDFVYGGAVDGRRHDDVDGVAAYRRGMALVRSAVDDAYVLGCGAPILPSIGLVDAMRVGPDTAPHREPPDGDLSQPASRSAVLTSGARAFQHGRFWVNDPDCLVARPEIEDREAWAAHVLRHGGLRGSSDRLGALDVWGLATTRRVLSERPPARFVPGPGEAGAG